MRAFYFCLLWVTAMNTHARTATEASDGATSIQVATVDSKSAVLLGVSVLRQGINPANDPPILLRVGMVRFNAYDAELPPHRTEAKLSVAGRESESLQLLLRLAPSAATNTTVSIRLLAVYVALRAALRGSITQGAHLLAPPPWTCMTRNASSCKTTSAHRADDG